MEKQKLGKFISKYNLAGLVESVKWESNDGSLVTAFISDDKSVLGSIKMTGFDFKDSSFGVFDTSKLTKMLGVMGNDIEFDISEADGKMVSLKFKDGSTSVNYMLADLSVIKTVPELKNLPPFDIKLKLDSTFIGKFIKAKGALSEENKFTFVQKDGKAQIILGYSSINTNRISIDVESESSEDVEAISFSADFLKEILIANKEASDATLNITSKGLAHIHFEIDEYVSDYYLTAIQE